MNKKAMAALVGTLAFGTATVTAFAGEAPKDEKAEKADKGKKDDKKDGKKHGEKSCGGDKGCGAKK
jgi:hypothetical protein